MKLKFKDGTIKNCTTPTEHKIFRAGLPAGWILSFNLIGNITSGEVDELVLPDNISELTFIGENELGLETNIVLSGYNKTTSATIRYSDGDEQTRVELQLTKEV